MTPQEICEILGELNPNEYAFYGSSAYQSHLYPKTPHYRGIPPLNKLGVYATTSITIAMVHAVMDKEERWWWCREKSKKYTLSIRVEIPKGRRYVFGDAFISVLRREGLERVNPHILYAERSTALYGLKFLAFDAIEFLKERGVTFVSL